MDHTHVGIFLEEKNSTYIYIFNSHPLGHIVQYDGCFQVVALYIPFFVEHVFGGIYIYTNKKWKIRPVYIL